MDDERAVYVLLCGGESAWVDETLALTDPQSNVSNTIQLWRIVALQMKMKEDL